MDDERQRGGHLSRRAPGAVLLLLALLGLWLGAGVATAPPAAAHAELVSTDPGEGARLEEPPTQVTLTFTEGVSLGAGHTRVLDASGERVDTGSATVEGDRVVVPLRGDLPDDGYLVTYRVVSADSHPVSGAFSFVVGDGELVPTDAAAGAGDTDPVVGAALPAARWLGFAGLSLAIGVPVLLLAAWPAGWASARLRRMVTGGLAAVAAGAALTFLLQGPYAAGSGLGSVADPALLAATADSANGVAHLLRIVLVAALAVVLHAVWRRGNPSVVDVVAGSVLAAALVGTVAAVGHPVAGPLPALAVTAAAVHVAAMVVWLGGLAGLLGGVLREEAPADDLARALPPFSRLAAGSVTALVVTGVVQSVREVGSPAALVTTTYGWVLLAKLALVLLLLAAAGVSRVWVQQHLGVRRSRPAPRRRVTAHAFAAAEEPEPDPAVASAAGARAEVQAAAAAAERPALRRSVLVELAVGLVVLALSAVLVGTPPARAEVAQPVDVTLPVQTAAGEDGSVQVSVDPAAAGPNTLHVYLLDAQGQFTQPVDIRVTLTEPAQEIGPIDVALEPAGPGHYVGDGMAVPGAGTWTLAVTVRLDEFTAGTASTTFPVR
ncbi:copper resistance CopC family protein [Geodermatophilus obscurus]|uniref:Copper resistance protein CopC n=1 Tax=Geodermatophilus obscurus (strain ATCC 25078 / DSM 43160 / JCM 3152 / CCUG 61914 / KCC A-0152 / KCTC 9177 / NBRC 13315 / NRRL B-3577 / G-20) TaxID=526225 RepID=D2SB68_GEOOG|nr:copper resistance CopC family protein [Geodermatophilus obscurus]ADB74016.1 copper resistance protein CopC [Geodermatophilus obscurus DSM 43160]